jgi:hypothetical protein
MNIKKSRDTRKILRDTPGFRDTQFSEHCFNSFKI